MFLDAGICFEQEGGSIIQKVPNTQLSAFVALMNARNRLAYVSARSSPPKRNAGNNMNCRLGWSSLNPNPLADVGRCSLVTRGVCAASGWLLMACPDRGAEGLILGFSPPLPLERRPSNPLWGFLPLADWALACSTLCTSRWILASKHSAQNHGPCAGRPMSGLVLTEQ